MGLAVLPSRLKNEMSALKTAILNNDDISSDELLSKHYEWSQMLKSKYTLTEDNIDDIIKDEIGLIFSAILEQCGVFERSDEGKQQFLRFIESV